MNHPPTTQLPNSAHPRSAALPALGPPGRAARLDVHPDSFAAAVLEGREPLGARARLQITQQPLAALGA